MAPYAIDPESEYGYHWHETADGDIVNTPDIGPLDAAPFVGTGADDFMDEAEGLVEPMPAAPLPVVPEQAVAGHRLAGFYEILGDHGLIDEGDEICGLDVLGAPYRDKKQGQQKQGQQKQGQQKRPSGASPLVKIAAAYKKALTGTDAVGKKALNIGNKGAVKVAQYNNAAKAGQHKTIVPTKITRVTGEGIVFGITPATAKGLTARQRAAISKHASAVGAHAAATKQLAKMSAKAIKTGTDAINFAKKKTTVLGADANGLDPKDPGYDPTTDPLSDQYQGAGSGQGAGAGGHQAGRDPATGIVYMPDGSPIYDPSRDGDVVEVPAAYDPSTDPNVPPDPPQRGGTLLIDDAWIEPRGIPADAVPFSSAGYDFAPYSKMSWAYYYGSKQHRGGGKSGFVYGPNRDGGLPNQWYGAWGKVGGGPQGSDADVVKKSHTGQITGAGPTNEDWGPLIGNPADPLFAGLQYSPANNAWFWQSQNVPAQVAVKVDNAIAYMKTKYLTDAANVANAAIQTVKEANKKTIEANTAAAMALVATAVKDAADQAEALAKQNAENALAESAATSAANVAQIQQQTQQSQMDLDAQKQAQDLAVQQAQADIQTQQAQAQMMQDHPELFAQQQADGGGDGGAPNPFALPGEEGFQAQPGLPDMSAPDFMDSAYAQGRVEAQANPFSDVGPDTGLPDFGDGQGDSFDLPPQESMIGRHPGAGNPFVNWRR